MHPSHIHSLDGLRALFITLVIATHFNHLQGAPNYALHLIRNLGSRGFLILSGFLITVLLLKELESKQNINLARFYLRRTLRIVPAFYFYLLIVFVCAGAGYIPAQAGSFVPAFLFISNYVSTESWFVGHSWSLSVQEQFYLLMPGLLLLVGKRQAFVALVLLLLICPIVRVISYRLYGDDAIGIYTLHYNADALATGCLLAFMRGRLHQYETFRRILKSKWFILVPILIIVANNQDSHPHLNYGACVTLINLGIVLCIEWAITNHEGFVGRALNCKPVTTIGMMSYSIYLWQQPFLSNELNGTSAHLLPNLLMIVITAGFSYYVIEKNTPRWRNILEKRLFAPNTRQENQLKVATENS